jgi:hypothetical protein
VHQLLILFAGGTLAARVGTQITLTVIVLAVFAVQVLGIGYGQCQTAAAGGSQQQLGVAYTSRVYYFGQVVYQNTLTLNIFKPHFTRKLNYKYIINY